jgi:hypothetical protein
MNQDRTRQIANLVAAIVTIGFNILANALPLNGQNTGEISDRFLVYFVPAGYVFSIWFVIYIGFLAFAIYQFLPSQRENPRLRRIGYLFVLASLANIAWLFFWHYNLFVLSLVAMLALLACLIAIYLRLDIGRSEVEGAEKWCVDIPFSIYLGWISVATIANVTDVLYYLGWDGGFLEPQAWAVVMILAAGGLGAIAAYTRGDIAFVLVLIWSLIGIGVKQAGAPLVAVAAWVMAGVLVLILILIALVRPNRQVVERVSR